MVIEGEVVLSYENQRVTRLIRLEQDRFDGGWNTTSFGKITDYNLMVRKGSEGYLDLIFPEKERFNIMIKRALALRRQAWRYWG